MAELIPPSVSDKRAVLLIEDNPGDACLIREMLREAQGAGFGLESMERLTPGFERLAQGGIDAVLLDLSLPESHGLDTLLRVRAQAARRACRRIDWLRRRGTGQPNLTVRRPRLLD